MDYGVDIPKKHSVFTRMSQPGKILAEGRIDNTPEGVATMLAPSQGKAQVVVEACSPGYTTCWNPMGLG